VRGRKQPTDDSRDVYKLEIQISHLEMIIDGLTLDETPPLADSGIPETPYYLILLLL
jgi:hypothetical protein